MPIFRPIILTACLLLALEASAQQVQDAERSSDGKIPDAVFKGVIGTALDALPIDAEKRVVLQRANAVVSGPLTGRTISAWAGITNPILLVAGAIWGIYAASNIKAPKTKVAQRADTSVCLGDGKMPTSMYLLASRPSAEEDIAEVTQ